MAGKPLMRMPTMLMGQSGDTLVCSYAVTGTKPVAQRLYECHTCGFTEANGSVICVTCAAVCHRGHHVVYKGFHNSAYCDCGSSPKPGVCQALKPLQFAPHASQEVAAAGAAGAAGKGGAPAAAAAAPPSFDAKQQPQTNGHAGAAAGAAAAAAAPEYCSYSVSGTRAVTFRSGVYECMTCVNRLPTGSVVCPLCARTCHAGHRLTHINKSVDATCDCGADPSICRALPPRVAVASAPPAAAVGAPVMIGAPVMVGGAFGDGMQFVPTTAAGLAAAAAVGPSATAAAAQWAANFMGGAVAVPVENIVAVAPIDGGAPPSFLGRAPSFGEVLPPPPDFVDLAPASASASASGSAAGAAAAAAGAPPPPAFASDSGAAAGPSSAPHNTTFPAKYSSVAQFLHSCDSSDLLTSFVAQDVDMPTLMALSEAALRDLIPKVGPRAKVAAKLDELRLKQALANLRANAANGGAHPQHGGAAAAAAAAAAAQAAAQAAAAAKMEVALNMYRGVVSRALEDGKAMSKDEKMLADLRTQYAISAEQHAQVLHGLQLSEQKWAELRRKGAQAEADAANGSGASECVVCLDAKADHIILPCAHICLCAGCGANFKPNMPCPKCRTPIASVRKTFSA